MNNAHISIKMFWLLCLSNKIISRQHYIVEYDRKTVICNFLNQGNKKKNNSIKLDKKHEQTKSKYVCSEVFSHNGIKYRQVKALRSCSYQAL